MITKIKSIYVVLAMAASIFGASAAFATTSSSTASQALDPTAVSVSVSGFKTINLQGIEGFGNDEVKQSILVEQEESVYNIPSLQYSIMGHTIKASDVQVNVDPTSIDDTRTRLNMQVLADNVQVTGPLLSESFEDFEIGSLTGTYNEITNKLVINLPYRTALSILSQ